MVSRAFISLTVCLLVVHCAGGSRWHDKPGEIGRLMVERLKWMDEVAAFKKARSLPVLDPAREETLLRSLIAQAISTGIDATAAEAFIKGQMAAGRHVQSEWLANSRQFTDSSQVPDLAMTIRPELDRISADLIRGLGRARKGGDHAAVMASAEQQLIEAGYSAAVIGAALSGLRAGLGAN